MNTGIIFQVLGDFVLSKLYRDFVARPLNITLYKNEIVNLNILLKALDYYEDEKGESESTLTIRSHATEALFNYINAFEEEIGGDGNFAAITEADKNRIEAVDNCKKLPNFQNYLDRVYEELVSSKSENAQNNEMQYPVQNDKDLQETLANQISTLKLKDDELYKLRQDNEHLQETVANQENKINSLESKINSLSTLKLSQDNEKLQKTVANQENKINSLESKINSLSTSKLSQYNEELQKTVANQEDIIKNLQSKNLSLSTSQPSKEEQKTKDQMSGCLGGIIAVPLALIVGVISNNFFIGFLVFCLVLGGILNMFESKK